MKDRYFKKIVYVLSCALLSAVFIVLLFFCAPEIKSVRPAYGQTVKEIIHSPDGGWEEKTFTAGVDFAAVSIEDLTNLSKLTKVNYVPNKFVQAQTLDPDMQIVDLTEPFEFAEKGSLIFVVLNLDPADEAFNEKSDKLAPYKIGDSWEFTVSLPKIFGASNIYNGSNLHERNGDIAGYDFGKYTDNYDIKTETFVPQTKPVELDIKLYTRRQALTSYRTVTVHYQSAGSAYSGISGCPFIGKKSEITGINERSNNLLIAFAIIAAVVFAILSVLSILERSKEFISAIIWLFGIVMLLLSRFLAVGATGVPLLWTAFALSASFFILGGALLAMGVNFKKAPTKYIFPALSAVGALLAFICPYVPFGAASALRIAYTTIKGVCVFALSAFICLALARKNDEHGILQTSCSTVIAVAVIASLFLPQVFPAQINPMFWMCVTTTLATFASVFFVFWETKKSNAYLTANLHREVERQVKDIKAMIAERDNLLRFVSHDMKKPLSSAVALFDTAIEREKDGEQVKTLQIIKQNCARVADNLSEIGAYAKFNYLAEPSRVVDLYDLCALLYKYHKLDCDANGIVLINAIDSSAKAFVKKQGLENVISNIIMNAVEHAKCSTITLSAIPDKNKTVLCISDDGKGIDSSFDIFKPYVSENDSKTGGVGLYICKSIVESMNGELTFESSRSGTSFYISMLKA